MTGSLCQLMDARQIQEELGVSKAVAKKIIREIAAETTVIAPATIRKVWVRRADVEAWLARAQRKIA